jgi:hypothetical protein
MQPFNQIRDEASESEKVLRFFYFKENSYFFTKIKMNKMNGTYLKKTPYICNVKIKDALVFRST